MYERGSKIIRDARVFDYDYVPDKLIGRNEQLDTLELLFRPLAEYGRPCTAMLMGPVGTGKTAAAKHPALTSFAAVNPPTPNSRIRTPQRAEWNIGTRGWNAKAHAPPANASAIGA